MTNPTPTLNHAVLWIDHHSAKLLLFDALQVQLQKVQAHTHDTGHHGSSVRTEHEFFGEVCDELAGIAQIVVTGSNTSLADLRRYIDKHRPALAAQVAVWETVNHPTDAQLVALARKTFAQREAGLTKRGALPADPARG